MELLYIAGGLVSLVITWFFFRGIVRSGVRNGMENVLRRSSIDPNTGKFVILTENQYKQRAKDAKAAGSKETFIELP